jgi:hypothetical protein
MRSARAVVGTALVVVAAVAAAPASGAATRSTRPTTGPTPLASLGEPHPPSKGDHYGAAVALAASGKLAAVGAPGHTVGGKADEGEVYLFGVDGPAVATPTAVPDPRPGRQGGDSFGAALAVSRSGGTVIVGAPTQGGGTGNGAAYVYSRTSTGAWERQAVLLPPAPAATGETRFGTAVALSAAGNQAAVTAMQAAPDDYGQVYLYDRSAQGTWSRLPQQLSPDVSDNDGFGASLALSAGAQTLLVGAPTWAYGGTHPGAVLVYTLGANSRWTQSAVLAVNGPTGFGTGTAMSMSTSGTTALIASSPDYRRVRIFRLTGGGWKQTAVLAEPASGFGSGVALTGTGTIAVIGADTSNVGAVRSGLVYVFTLKGSTWRQTRRLTPPSPLPNMVFGAGVATTMRGAARLVGLPGEQTTGTERERAYLYG